MPDSERFDLIPENGRQLDEWEQLSQAKFQRKSGEHFLKIGHAVERGETRFGDHEERIVEMEKCVTGIKWISWTSYKLWLAIGGLSGLITFVAWLLN